MGVGGVAMAWGIFKLPSTKIIFVVDVDGTGQKGVLGRPTAGDRLFYEIERELQDAEKAKSAKPVKEKRR